MALYDKETNTIYWDGYNVQFLPFLRKYSQKYYFRRGFGGSSSGEFSFDNVESVLKFYNKEFNLLHYSNLGLDIFEFSNNKYLIFTDKGTLNFNINNNLHAFITRFVIEYSGKDIRYSNLLRSLSRFLKAKKGNVHTIINDPLGFIDILNIRDVVYDGFGNSFKSIKDMCKYHKCTDKFYEYHKGRGLTNVEIFTLWHKKQKELKFKYSDGFGNTFKTIIDMCKYHKCPKGFYRRNKSKGLTNKEIFTLWYKNQKERVILHEDGFGNSFKTIKDMVMYHKSNGNFYYKYKSQGLTNKEIFTLWHQKQEAKLKDTN